MRKFRRRASAPTADSSEPLIGQIMLFGGNFAPRGWAFCEGQLLAITSNQALFSVLGTTYGGDGRTTFGLPDLRGRAPIHHGTGTGLPTSRLGQKRGGNLIQKASGATEGSTQPTLAVSYCIALVGVFPSRN